MSRIDGRQFFLTYSHCDADAQELIDFFNSIAPLEFCRVAIEHHQDGMDHRHAVLRFSRRVQGTMRRFDYNIFHPNVQAVRNMDDALRYCTKERFLDYGIVPEPRAIGPQRMGWDDIVQAAAGPELDWLRIVHEQRIQPHVAQRMREMQSSLQYDLDEYDNRPLQDILVLLPPTYTSLCVVGEPGIGKTGWAMQNAPRPALLVKHLDCLRRFRAGHHQSIVFDDVDFKHLPRTTQLQIADYENQVQVHVRYGVALIPARVPRLFLCNPGCEPFVYDPAIEGRRVQVIRL